MKLSNCFLFHVDKAKRLWKVMHCTSYYISFCALLYNFLLGFRVFHLLVNLAVQILLGIPLEMVHKWWRVLLVYFAGVLAGSLATSITDPDVRLAGASGGVYSLITAHVASIIMVSLVIGPCT